MFQFHRWEIITEDGETFYGEDNFPTFEMKDNAKEFVLETPNSPVTVFIVPTGHRLIFIKRNQIYTGEDFEKMGEAHHYIVFTEPK
jgi:hypothetical protein